ncbi:BatA domain-containing protein [Sphingomonas sp.]
MTPALLAPFGLLAMVAIAIPLAIHLAHRTEMRPVDFAALRWLDARPRPRQRLRLDERLLLAARILLIALIAILLAQPVLWGADDTSGVVAVHPTLTAPAPAAGTRQLWLAPGFAPTTDAAPTPPANPASLIRQLDADLAPDVALTILVPPALDGLDAQRPRLSRRVEWRVADAPMPPPTQPSTLPPITIRHTPAMREAARYFRAVAVALSPQGSAVDIAASDTPLPDDARHIVWLADGPLPATLLDRVADGATLLVGRGALLAIDAPPQPAWRGDDGQPLATERALGRGRVLQLTRAVDPAEMPLLADATFPDRLAAILFPPPPPARAYAADHAPLAGAQAYPRPPLDLTPWLAFAIALVFAAERWLATRARRTIAP